MSPERLGLALLLLTASFGTNWVNAGNVQRWEKIFSPLKARCDNWEDWEDSAPPAMALEKATQVLFELHFEMLGAAAQSLAAWNSLGNICTFF